MDSALFIKALGGFFAIMNPFVALPIFLSLTEGTEPSRQRHLAIKVAIFSAVLSVAVAASGSALLRFFGISVDDFRVAGGLVVLMIALGMLNGSGNPAHQGTPSERSSQAELEDVSFYPMTFPMVVGPGTITTIIVFMGQATGTPGLLSLGAAVALVLAALAIVLWFAPDIGHLMSQSLHVIMTRLMGMILAAIAVDMIAAGLTAILPGLSG